MPADDPNGWAPGGMRQGFHSYADDTPREMDEDLRLTEREAPEPTRRKIPWLPVIAGGAGAVALGVVALLAADAPGSDAPEAAAGGRLPVEVAEITLPKPPPVSETTPLEVLPETGERETIDLAPDVPLPVPRARTEAPEPPQTEPSPRVEEAAPRSPQLAVTGVPATAAAVEPPQRDPCAGAPSPGAEMVCRDPELAAADRRMRRAYDAALASGAPEEMLALEQEDWRDIRELAAQRSRRAVASIYRQRTEELRMMARERWW